MAYATIIFEHPDTGEIKKASLGVSWVMLFFSFWVPLVRGDKKLAIKMFFLFVITFGLSSIMYMFIYNKIYIKDLINLGFEAKSINHGDIYNEFQKMDIKTPEI
jgi:hypothetical protein